jgi:hypothetical protein
VHISNTCAKCIEKMHVGERGKVLDFPLRKEYLLVSQMIVEVVQKIIEVAMSISSLATSK